MVLAENDPTWVWAALEVAAVALCVSFGLLWRRAMAGQGRAKFATRYRHSALLAAFWSALIAARLVFHAY